MQTQSPIMTTNIFSLTSLGKVIGNKTFSALAVPVILISNIIQATTLDINDETKLDWRLDRR